MPSPHNRRRKAASPKHTDYPPLSFRVEGDEAGLGGMSAPNGLTRGYFAVARPHTPKTHMRPGREGAKEPTFVERSRPHPESRNYEVERAGSRYVRNYMYHPSESDLSISDAWAEYEADDDWRFRPDLFQP